MRKTLISWLIASIPLGIFAWVTVLNLREGMPIRLLIIVLVFAGTVSIGISLSHRWFLKHYPAKPWLASIVAVAWAVTVAAIVTWLAPRLTW